MGTQQSEVKENTIAIIKLSTECARLSDKLEEANKIFDGLNTRVDKLTERMTSLEIRMERLTEGFSTVQKIVFGLVGLVLVAVATAVISLVLTK